MIFAKGFKLLTSLSVLISGRVQLDALSDQWSQATYSSLSEPEEEGHARQATAIGPRSLAADEAAYPAYPLTTGPKYLPQVIHGGSQNWSLEDPRKSSLS